MEQRTTPAGRRRRRWSLLAAAGCIAVLAACGSSDDDGGTQSAAATQAAATTGASSPFEGLDGTITWYETAGGNPTKMRKSVVFPAFTDLTGVEVRQDYNGDAAKLNAAMEAGGKLPWDVIEFPGVGDFLNARDKGYLAKLDPKIVPLDQLEPGSYDEYGIRAERYGIVLAWNTDVWPKDGKHPTSIKDIYNTEEFPGKRCMFQYPAFGGTLESALLADGVPREELYPLDTKRAYAKLDTIKDDIVWYERDAPKLLVGGECDMAIAWSGQIYNAVEKDGAPLAISWDDGLYAEGVFAIPKDTPNMAAAQAMLAFLITDEETQRQFVEATAYPMAIKGRSYPADLEPWLALGDNLATVVPENAEYYQKHLADLSDEFFAWSGS